MMTTPTRDPLGALTSARPTDSSLDAAWTTARAETVFAKVADTSTLQLARAGRTTTHVPRRWIAVAATSAAAVAVLTTLLILAPQPSMVPASAVERLATTARTAPAIDIPVGRYLHTVTEDAQSPGKADDAERSPATQGRDEAWTDASGTIWRIETRTVDGTTYRSTDRIDTPAADVGTIPRTVTGLQLWPTSGPELDHWLRERITVPSDQEDDSVFETLKDQLALANTPPEVRAAAVEAIADLPGTKVVTQPGRIALRYASQSSNPGLVQTLVFDDATSRLVEVTETSPFMTYSSRTTAVELVDTLPAALARLQAD
jgi:hypothetical protein